jgi:hypothetical protein
VPVRCVPYDACCAGLLAPPGPTRSHTPQSSWSCTVRRSALSVTLRAGCVLRCILPFLPPPLTVLRAVFLERQFAEFLPKLAADAGGNVAEAEAKVIDILQKSWKKMGPLGRAAALKLPLEPRLAALVGRALEAPAQ